MKKAFFEIVLPFILLTVMAGFLIFSARSDTATMDEAPHIPSGYSYVLKSDMRLNPEHPPLVKALAGIPVLFLRNVNFPENHPAWREGINDQWSFGFDFLYRSGNDAEKIVHAARIAPIFLTLLLGFFIWRWARELVGTRWALLPLFLFSFSPNFVGHGKLVTTDVGAALGVFISLYFFTKYLKAETRKNLLIAGLSLGIGLSLKFPVAFVVPVIVGMGLLHAFVSGGIRGALSIIIKLAGVGVIAALVLLSVYLLVTWNYPVERQVRDANYILASYGFRPTVNLMLWMMEKPVLRAWAQYLFGFLMNLQRAAGGHTTYFLGEISASGWWYYFPLVYLIKEPIPILVVVFLGALVGLFGLMKTLQGRQGPVSQLLRDQIGEVGMLLFIAGFWFSSVTSHLNIGVRHIFPTLPLLYLLSAKAVKSWAGADRKKIGFICMLAAWLFYEFVSVSPHFIAYFNEFIGGPKNAAHYVVDSNLDWGQDLKRLRDFVVKNDIKTIKVDYFGGGDAPYYLGNHYEPLVRGVPQKGWIAVSASFLKGGQGRFAPGHRDECCYYLWLNQYEPVAKIGYSIYVYFIP